MKKLSIGISIIAAALFVGTISVVTPGCTTTTVTPGAGTNAPTTNTVTKSLDPVAIAQIDSAVSNIIANAPAAIADAQAISALVHGTNK